MTPKQLRAVLARMGLSQRGAARLLNIDERTMRKYVAGDLVIPEMLVWALRGLAQRDEGVSTSIVRSALGPLPEDFCNVQNSQPDHSIRKRKLSARLAEASNRWHCTKDDQEGREQRRKAVQMALGAVLEWAYAEGIPAEHLQLLVGLTSDLEDPNSGKRPKLMMPALRPKRGRPPLTTGSAARLATICAAVNILSRNQPRKLTGDIEKEVARTIGIGVGALRSRRKKFNAGKSTSRLIQSDCRV
jgi:hypothetical protein